MYSLTSKYAHQEQFSEIISKHNFHKMINLGVSPYNTVGEKLDKFGFDGPILFKLCMEVAYCSPGRTCYMAFAIKGQTKAAVTLKGNFGIYGPILILQEQVVPGEQ